MAVKLKAKVRGLNKVIKKFEKLGPAGSAAVRTAMYKVGNEIMEKSLRITPKYDGWLRNTWYCTKPYKNVGFCELGYGADYAHHVHEMPSTVNWSEPGTGNKFLEKPFNERRTSLASDIGKYAQERFDINKTSPTFGVAGIPEEPKTGPGNKR
jgi:hypothetical protein